MGIGVVILLGEGSCCDQLRKPSLGANWEQNRQNYVLNRGVRREEQL